MNILETIGLTSSIITITLFILYIIAKIILINQMKFTVQDTFEIQYLQDVKERESKANDNNVIYVIELDTINKDEYESIYFISTVPVRNFNVYKYDFEKNDKGDLVSTYGKFKNGQSIEIKGYLTCGIPNYILEYERFDYMKGKLPLAEEGMTGNLTNNLMIHHTFRSYIYYLVK